MRLYTGVSEGDETIHRVSEGDETIHRGLRGR